MRKVWDCLLRSVLPRCLCLLLASSIILWNTSIESNASSSSDYDYLDWQTKTITLDRNSTFTISDDGLLVSGGSKSGSITVSNFYSLFDLNENTNYVFDKSGFSSNVTGEFVSCTNTTGSATNWKFTGSELVFSDDNNLTPVLPTALGLKYSYTYNLTTVSYTSGYLTYQKYNVKPTFHLTGDITIKYAVYAMPNTSSGGSGTDGGASSASDPNRVVDVGNYHFTTEDHSYSFDVGNWSYEQKRYLGYNFEVGNSYRITFDMDWTATTEALINATEGVPSVTDMSIQLCGVEFPLTGKGAYSFDFVALTSSDLLTCLYDTNVFYFVLDIYDTASHMVLYSDVYLNDITITNTTARTTNEILEDMEAQDKVTQKIENDQLNEQKEQTETQKGIWESIKDFFGSFFQNLIDSIIHVIVPTGDEMSDLFNRLNDFFAETFGFLYYPFDFIIDAFNIFLTADSETGLTLPGFSIMGYEVWPDMTYDITNEPVVGQIFGYVRMGTGAMLAMWFVNYLRNFFDKRFGGGGN